MSLTRTREHQVTVDDFEARLRATVEEVRRELSKTFVRDMEAINKESYRVRWHGPCPRVCVGVCGMLHLLVRAR